MKTKNIIPKTPKVHQVSKSPRKSKSKDSSLELIRFDWAMKRMLRQKANFKALEGLLTVLFKEDMKIINIKENESNKQNPHQKFNRVDILVENSRHELLIIEMQNSEESDYFLRMLFGVSKVTVEHIKKGDPYSTIPKVYHINIVYFQLGVGDDYVYHGITEFRGLHTKKMLNLTKDQKEFFEPIRKKTNKVKDLFPEYYILCVDDFDKVAKDNLDEWIHYLKYNSIPDHFTAPGLDEVREQLRYDKLSPQEKIDYDQHIKQKVYEQSAIDTAIFKGKLKGRAESKKELVKKDDTIAQLNEQLTQNAINTALKLMEKGMTIEEISEITGLTTKQIQKLTTKIQ